MGINTGKAKDHTGTTFGRLTCVKRIAAKISKSKYTEYECTCSCGNIVIIRACQLVTGNTTSCGCFLKESLRKTRTINRVNQIFGRLTALERIQKPNRGVDYRCLCTCGKEVMVDSGKLQSGNTKSCGCLNIEEIIKRNHDPILILKRMKACNDSSIHKHWKLGIELVCKGGWEHRVVEWLNKHKIDFDWQVPFKLPDGRTYIIDFFDKDRNVYVEIKGWWRDDGLEKHETFKAAYPDLKVEVWDKAELEMRNISIRKKHKIPLYILTGAPGSGKSWVLKQLTNFYTIDSDVVSPSKYKILVREEKDPILTLTIGVSTFIKNNPDLEIKLIVIQEDIELLKARMLARNGKVTTTIERRAKRMLGLAKQAEFTGTSTEVLTYLKEIK